MHSARLAARWRGLPLRLRLPVQVGVVLVGGAAGFLLLRNRADIDATTASVLVAVGFGVVGYLQSRQQSRREHTVSVLSMLQTTETLCEADGFMAGRIARGEPVTDDIAPDDDRLVITLLDYYEFLCVLVERSHIDGSLLADLRGPAMRRAWELCRPYIDVRRGRIGPDLYGRFDRFVTQTLPVHAATTTRTPT